MIKHSCTKSLAFSSSYINRLQKAYMEGWYFLYNCSKEAMSPCLILWNSICSSMNGYCVLNPQIYSFFFFSGFWSKKRRKRIVYFRRCQCICLKVFMARQALNIVNTEVYEWVFLLGCVSLLTYALNFNGNRYVK